MDSFSGSRAVLSGPAGGVVGYAATTYRVEGGQPVIGFDMGGMKAEGWGQESRPQDQTMPGIQVRELTPHTPFPHQAHPPM